VDNSRWCRRRSTIAGDMVHGGQDRCRVRRQRHGWLTLFADDEAAAASRRSAQGRVAALQAARVIPGRQLRTGRARQG